MVHPPTSASFLTPFAVAKAFAASEDRLLLTSGRGEEYPAVDKTPAWRASLVGASPSMERIADLIARTAARRATVLITGETGTGKEMVARALHMASSRSQLPMVTVNTAALPENLLEAELFGHVKGAFTGASSHRVGRFEQAHKSTLFLDEIGDLPLDMQTKLLRFLQEREFQRIGSSETVKVDVRVIAETNIDLAARVRTGKFREDLYYRLNVVPIETPPLRERLEDIPLLAEHFVRKICALEGIPIRCLTPQAIASLQRRSFSRHGSWPGNVRELENCIERAIALSGDREVLLEADFPLDNSSGLLHPSASAQAAPAELRAFHLPEGGLDFEYTIETLERQLFTEALARTNGNKTAAAELLGLKRTTLAAKMLSLKMDCSDRMEIPRSFSATGGN